jgi:hypothetical protein
VVLRYTAVRGGRGTYGGVGVELLRVDRKRTKKEKRKDSGFSVGL